MTPPDGVQAPEPNGHGLDRGLANAHYIDAETIRRENRAVLFDTWAAIAFAKDVPEHGDTQPITFLGQPLLLVRTLDGDVRVFENVCRHRGMILVETPTRFKTTIRCPYHSWCYGFDGALKTTPHVGGPGVHRHDAVKTDALGLIPVRSVVWMDTVYVNLSGAAPDFAEHIRPLAERWTDYADRPLYFGGPESAFTLDVACNWKLAVENYCESYHLPWVHPGLNQYSRLEDHYEILDAGGTFSGQGTNVYAPSFDETGRRFQPFADLPEKWNTAAEYVALYPNVLLGVHKDHTFAIRLEPLDDGRTREHVAIYYADPAMTADDWRSMREKNAAMWQSVFVEDVFVVEGMQKGRLAPGFDGGAFSPVMDRPTQAFHAWVARRFETAPD